MPKIRKSLWAYVSRQKGTNEKERMKIMRQENTGGQRTGRETQRSVERMIVLTTA